MLKRFCCAGGCRAGAAVSRSASSCRVDSSTGVLIASATDTLARRWAGSSSFPATAKTVALAGPPSLLPKTM
ncbi:hypothetical protein [Lysobacter gummosus]|uniref:hypothetical protein n=1 Tax=Lysobacter gummosus TaxID=262324 RepID=UPI0036327A22